jgi:hypothetical protein
MWECPICGEVRDDCEPGGHRHYIYRFVGPTDSDDCEFVGGLLFTEKADLLGSAVMPLMYFEEGQRKKTLDSLDLINLKLPSFPVHLRKFLQVCLGHQSDDIPNDEEGFAIGKLMCDVNGYIDSVLERCTKDLRITCFSVGNMGWQVPARLYWAEDPKTCAMDCVQRLIPDIDYLRRLRLRRSKYAVDH